MEKLSAERIPVTLQHSAWMECRNYIVETMVTVKIRIYFHLGLWLMLLSWADPSETKTVVKLSVSIFSSYELFSNNDQK